MNKSSSSKKNLLPKQFHKENLKVVTPLDTSNDVHCYWQSMHSSEAILLDKWRGAGGGKQIPTGI